MNRRLIALVFSAYVASVMTAALADATPAMTMTDPNSPNLDAFGAGLALSGDAAILVVGAPNTLVNSTAQVGLAYVYLRSNGGFGASPSSVIEDPELLQGDQFGASVAVSGDGSVLLMSATGGDSGAARVYVYNRYGGAPLAILEDPDTHGDCFGQSLAVSADGSTALVGANCASVNGIQWAGKAYLYTRNNGIWSPRPAATLTEPAPATEDFFGISVALSQDGTTALIGSNDFNSVDPLGRAYVYAIRAGNWQTVVPAVLTDPSGAPGTMFGSSVAVSADGATALIGAGIGGAGKEAYVFNGSGGVWSASTAFDAPPAHTTTGFVSTVRLSADGQTALVGLITGCGQAHLFQRFANGWSQEPDVTFSDPANSGGDDYGWSTALSADGMTQIIGSPYAVSHSTPSNGLFSSVPGPGIAYEYRATPAAEDSGGKGAVSPLMALLLMFFIQRRRRYPQPAKAVDGASRVREMRSIWRKHVGQDNYVDP